MTKRSRIQSRHSCASCFTLYFWLPWIHILNMNEHLKTGNNELYFSHADPCFPFQKYLQVSELLRGVLDQIPIHA